MQASTKDAVFTHDSESFIMEITASGIMFFFEGQLDKARLKVFFNLGTCDEPRVSIRDRCGDCDVKNSRPLPTPVKKHSYCGKEDYHGGSNQYTAASRRNETVSKWCSEQESCPHELTPQHEKHSCRDAVQHETGKDIRSTAERRHAPDIFRTSNATVEKNKRANGYC